MTAIMRRARCKRVNEALHTLGLTYHVALPIADIDRILSENGFEETEPAIYCGRDGQSHEQVGHATWFHMTWHKMDVTGKYEVVAYVN